MNGRRDEPGWRIALFYHSHPQHDAYFSPTDKAQALYADPRSTASSRRIRESPGWWSRSTTASRARREGLRVGRGGARLRRDAVRVAGAAMPELDRGGWTLRYEVAGDGPELVVLTHGFGATAETWRHQVPALVAAGYRVLTWDLRAHGRSGSPDEPITIAHARGGSRRGRAAVGGVAGARARAFGGRRRSRCASRSIIRSWCAASSSSAPRASATRRRTPGTSRSRSPPRRRAARRSSRSSARAT